MVCKKYIVCIGATAAVTGALLSVGTQIIEARVVSRQLKKYRPSYLSNFLPCLILVSIGVWLCEGRNTFLPFLWDPVTSRGSGSLRSSHGRGWTNTKYDRYTLDHVIKFVSRICISKLPIMWWSTFLIIQSKQKNDYYFFYK